MRLRPNEASEGRALGGTEGDRGLPKAEGGRVQGIRDRGTVTVSTTRTAGHSAGSRDYDQESQADDAQQHSSGNKSAEQQAEKDTQKKLDEIKQIGQKTGPKVVDDLYKAVIDVRPEVPNKVSQPVL